MAKQKEYVVQVRETYTYTVNVKAKDDDDLQEKIHEDVPLLIDMPKEMIEKIRAAGDFHTKTELEW